MALSLGFILSLNACGQLAKNKNSFSTEDKVFNTASNNQKLNNFTINSWPCIYTDEKDLLVLSLDINRAANLITEKNREPVLLVAEVPFMDNSDYYNDTSYQEGHFSISATSYQKIEVLLKNNISNNYEFMLDKTLPLKTIKSTPEIVLLFNYVLNKNKQVLTGIIGGDNNVFEDIDLSFNAYKNAVKLINMQILLEAEKLNSEKYTPIILINYFENIDIDPLNFYIRNYLLVRLFERHSSFYNMDKNYQNKLLCLNELSKMISKKDILKLQQRFRKYSHLSDNMLQYGFDNIEQDFVYRILIEWLREDVDPQTKAKIWKAYNLDI